MSDKKRSHVDDLRGASRLAIDAVEGVTSLVEEMHRTIGGGPAILGKPLAVPVRAVTGLVYGSVRRIARLVGAGLDVALGELSPLLSGSEPGAEREALLSAINGVLGDYLAETRNPLAIPMRMRHAGRPLTLSRTALQAAFPEAGGKLLLLVHGSSMNDGQWLRKGHDHGAALARDLGFVPLYLHYNSGLHVSDNGALLAALLEELTLQWPVPVQELAIVAHSMGGLVARSACLVAEATALAWRRLPLMLVCLGTPHQGAALERGGSWVELLLGVSRYSAPLARLGRIRSAGVTDLRYGYVLDSQWRDRDRFAHGGAPATVPPLPVGVACYAAAASLSTDGSGTRGDGLVSVRSALGLSDDPAMALAFPQEHRWIGHGMGHLDLLDRAEVYAVLHRWLSG